MLTSTSLARADRHMLLNAGNDVYIYIALVETGIHSSDRYGGAAACRHLWTMVHSLYIARCRIGSQCKSSRSVAVMWSYLRFRMTRRAAVFRTDCRACRLAALI